MASKRLVDFYHYTMGIRVPREKQCNGQYEKVGSHQGAHGEVAELRCTKCGHRTDLLQGVLDNLR